MSTQTKSAVTKEKAEEYIQTALINGKLEMKQACEELGWSFPRIRSKAMTICKKLGGEFVKESRGVYFLRTNQAEQPETGNEITEDSAEDIPTAEEVEAAIMKNLEDNVISNSSENVEDAQDSEDLDI